MKKWEHKIVDNQFDTEKEFGDYLSNLGEDGWECCILNFGWKFRDYTIGYGSPVKFVCTGIFKREKL
jgi:hypothetical protein